MILGTEEAVKNQEFFSCDCHSEGMLVTDWGGGEDDYDISVALFTVGSWTPKRTLLSRIKYAWQHLRTGKIWEDEIILTYDTAERLGTYLLERSSALKEKKK